MKASLHRRPVTFLLGGIAVAVLVVLVLYTTSRAIRDPATIEKSPREESQPSLNCAFYDFMHARIIAGFDFVVAFENGQKPSFYERSEGSDTIATTTFDAKHRPTWTFGHDEDGTSTITSPDGATLIVLYGLKLDAPGALLIEAGIRSNDYRNLGGECRQIDFGGQSGATTSIP